MTTIALSPTIEHIAKYGTSKPANAELMPSNGTGAYNHCLIDADDDGTFYVYCESEDSAFYLIDTESNAVLFNTANVLVEVIRGNIDTILKMVAAELEHYEEVTIL